jgi:hypothetical protein
VDDTALPHRGGSGREFPSRSASKSLRAGVRGLAMRAAESASRAPPPPKGTVYRLRRRSFSSERSVPERWALLLAVGPLPHYDSRVGLISCYGLHGRRVSLHGAGCWSRADVPEQSVYSISRTCRSPVRAPITN